MRTNIYTDIAMVATVSVAFVVTITAIALSYTRHR